MGRPKSNDSVYNLRIYDTWTAMKQRCLNPNNRLYSNYGGRGITVCNDWLEFKPFYEWSLSNGYTEELTIDRIDVNGNYEPSNCRWVTIQEQQFNTRRNINFTIDGETKCLKQWCNLYGANYETVFGRIKRGWDVKKALITPPKEVGARTHRKKL